MSTKQHSSTEMFWEPLSVRNMWVYECVCLLMGHRVNSHYCLSFFANLRFWCSSRISQLPKGESLGVAAAGFMHSEGPSCCPINIALPFSQYIDWLQTALALCSSCSSSCTIVVVVLPQADKLALIIGYEWETVAVNYGMHFDWHDQTFHLFMLLYTLMFVTVVHLSALYNYSAISNHC